MKAYWYTDNPSQDYGNVGDMLTPIIIKHLTGERPEWVNHNTPGKLLAVGSLCELIQDRDVVWGTGFIGADQAAIHANPKKRDVQILAVRGPKTAEALRKIGYDVPVVYGDPAVLMPDIYQPGLITKKYKVGYVPHYIEREAWENKYNGQILINVVSRPMYFIDRICECEKIVTSSLHAYILAQAYGVQAEYLQLTSKIIGGYFKYEDYIAGRGDNIYDCRDRLIKVFNGYCKIK